MTTYVEYKFCERGFDSELRHGSPTGADAKHGISSVLLADAATDVDDTATQPSDAGVLGLTHLAVVLLHFSRWRYCLLALAMQCIGWEQNEATSPNGTGDWTRFPEAVGHGGVVAGAAVRRTQAAPVHSPDFCRPIRLSRLISAVWDSRGGDNDHMYINQA